MKLTDLTVILPTRNEAQNIGMFLASLPHKVRLIVVDSSSDTTPDLIAELRPTNTLTLRRQATITEARQIGAEAATTRWLLFTDADVRFAPDYFARLETLGDAGVIYGAKRSSDEFTTYYTGFVWGQRLLHGMGIPAASGSNLLVRRDAFAAAGGFDLSLSCNEDSELVWRAKRAGCRVDFVPGLVVYETDHRRLRRGVVRKVGHSLVRCAMLYLNLMPSRWRTGDWNYWAGLPDRGAVQMHDPGK